MAIYMTRKKLMELIKEKFGTYSNFCDVAKLDRYKLQKTFFGNVNCPQGDIDELEKIVNKTENEPLIEFQKAVKKIKRALKKYGGAYKFSKDYPDDFNENTIHQIIMDNTRYKRMTPVVESLMEKLGIS